jgi:lysophospholipase L1-like esterase
MMNKGIFGLSKASRGPALLFVVALFLFGCGGSENESFTTTPPPGSTNPNETNAESWNAVWATAHTGATTARFDKQTLRQVVHPTGSGNKLVIKLRNFFSTDSVTLGSVIVSQRDSGNRIVEGSSVALLFNGAESVTLEPGQDIYSDPVEFTTTAFKDIVVDLFVDGAAVVSQDGNSYLTSYVSPAGSGNFAGQNSDADFSTTTTATSLLEEVSVLSSSISGVIVAIGGSVVDGVGSDVDAHNRWTDWLAQRLATEGTADRKFTVLNEGISGNTTQNVIDRFDRDVLDKTGVTHVIIYAGTNDLAAPPPAGPTAEQVIENYRTLIQATRDAGKKIIISTITPRVLYLPMSNEVRKTINQWILKGRNCSGECDGVVDFDSVLAWSFYPNMIDPAFDSGDTIHPNGLGYQHMADDFELDLFQEAIQN